MTDKKVNRLMIIANILVATIVFGGLSLKILDYPDKHLGNVILFLGLALAFLLGGVQSLIYKKTIKKLEKEIEQLKSKIV